MEKQKRNQTEDTRPVIFEHSDGHLHYKVIDAGDVIEFQMVDDKRKQTMIYRMHMATLQFFLAGLIAWEQGMFRK